jgi:hypothetical protein
MLTKLDALIIFILSLIIIGVFIPSLISSFIDVSQPNKESIVLPVASFFKGLAWYSGGWVVALISPWFSFPQTLLNYYNSMWNSYTFLPDWLSLPLLLIQFILILYVIFIGWGGS